MKSKVLVGAAVSGLVFTGAYCAGGGADKGPAPEASNMGQCHGINECKGKGACGGDKHDCAGKNSCKGKGWIKMSQEDCEAKKGTYKAG